MEVYLLQTWCAVLIAFEAHSIYRILLLGVPLSEATPWFRQSTTKDRPAFLYLYCAILAQLAFSRGMLCYLPRMRLLCLYNLIVHAAETVFFWLLSRHLHAPLWGRARSASVPLSPKDAQRETERTFLLSVMAANVVIFAGHCWAVRRQQKQDAVTNEAWRQEQLKEIRRRRAAYRQEQLGRTNSPSGGTKGAG